MIGVFLYLFLAFPKKLMNVLWWLLRQLG